MKIKAKKQLQNKADVREQVMRSMVASFKIEGISISAEKATKSLEKVSAKLGKQK